MWAPNVNLVRAESKAQSQLGTEVNWADELEHRFPFRFNTIVVHDGTRPSVRRAIATKDALKASNIDGEITNMTNVERPARRPLRASRRPPPCSARDRRRSAAARTRSRDADLRREPDRQGRAAAEGQPVAARVHQGGRRGRRIRALHRACGGGREVPRVCQADHAATSTSTAASEPEENPFKRLWEGHRRLRRRGPRGPGHGTGGRPHPLQRDDPEPGCRHPRDDRERPAQRLRQRLRPLARGQRVDARREARISRRSATTSRRREDWWRSLSGRLAVGSSHGSEFAASWSASRIPARAPRPPWPRPPGSPRHSAPNSRCFTRSRCRCRQSPTCMPGTASGSSSATTRDRHLDRLERLAERLREAGS